MIEPTFERRIHTWLEAGPTDLPPDAIDLLRVAIDNVAQERPPTQLFGRKVSTFRLRLAAAAVVMLVAAGGAIWLRSSLPNIANERSPDDLLYGFPDAITVVERSGVAGGQQETVQIGGLHGGGAFVLVGSCTGGDGMLARAFVPREIQGFPSDGGTPPRRAEFATLAANCDGLVHSIKVSTQDLSPEMTSDVELDVAAGVTWRFAIGEYPELAARPAFPAVAPSDGWYVVLDGPATLVTSELPSGIPVPDGATSIAVFVQCSGDPVSVSAPGSAPTKLECQDPAAVTRVEYPAIGEMLGVRVVTEGATWVRLRADADGRMTTVLPTAPPLPAGLADAPFADSDGIYLAVGRLGSNEQTVVHAPGAQVGFPGGDVVGVAVRDERGATRIEVWSIRDAARLRILATIPAGDNVGRTWVDASHEQLFYTVFKADFSTEWHRAAVDGSGDRVIATSPAGSVLADGQLAIDDSAFVVDSCPEEGSCTRALHDAASDVTREVELAGERTCEFIGVAAGRIVALSGSTCAEGDGVHMTTQDLDGGQRNVLVEGHVSGVIVRGSSRDYLVYWLSSDESPTYSSIALDGGAPRELLTAAEAGFGGLSASSRLPVRDWVLLSGPLADTFMNRSASVPIPRLLNVVTGQVIELANLPHTIP